MKRRVERITERAYNMAISRIFNRNIRIHGNSLSKGSIRSKLNRKGYHILELDENNNITIAAGWRSELRTMLTHEIK